MRNGNTSMPLLLAGIAVLLIIAIFIVSRQNTTIAPERIAPTEAPSADTGLGNGGTNQVVEGDTGTQQLKGIDITISNYTYSPATITVKKGTTITWSNEDTVEHTVTALDNSFDSGLIGNGDLFSHTFDSVGTFNYYCKPHPQMKGVIIVTE